MKQLIGEYPIYSTYLIDGEEYILSEKIDSHREAFLAAHEYRLEDLYSRILPSSEGCYYIYTRHGPRRRSIHTFEEKQESTPILKVI